MAMMFRGLAPGLPISLPGAMGSGAQPYGSAPAPQPLGMDPNASPSLPVGFAPSSLVPTGAPDISQIGAGPTVPPPSMFGGASRWSATGGIRDQLQTLAGHMMAMGGMPAASEAYLAPIQQRQQEQQAFARQQWILGRQIAADNWKANNQPPPEIQRVHDYLAKIDPTGKLASAYLDKETAPPLVAVDGFDSHGNPTKTFMPRTLPGTASGSPVAPVPAVDKAGYDALPPGASYIAPDGSHRVKGGAAPQASAPFHR